MLKTFNMSCRYSTPLHDAVACGRQEIAKILIERGANVSFHYNPNYHYEDEDEGDIK